MDRIKQLGLIDPEDLCKVSRALSSMERVQILRILEEDSYNVIELASMMNIPASSAGMHIRVLEEAGLIRTQVQPGTHGSAKLCSRTTELITIRLQNLAIKEGNIQTISMPLGAYTDCEVYPTCGLGGETESIGISDSSTSFYLPERLNAQILWTAAGYVEYRFPNIFLTNGIPKKLVLSMEICSEAPNYREDWKSDITVWFNGVDCGTWTCPGDFGSRRGILTPPYILHGSTQYGLLTTWAIDQNKSYVNEKPLTDVKITDLGLENTPYVTVKIGNKNDAKYKGGFNIFGKKAGDYAQDIQLTFEYE